MGQESQRRTRSRKPSHFQHTFLYWLEQNSSRFLVPVLLTRSSSQCVELKFENFPDVLSVRVNPLSLDVFVVLKRKSWDMLISLDINPEPCPGGYRCTLCGDFSVLWPSVDALCLDHLYEPFLSWVNNELERADKLLICQSSGATWALLCNDKDRPCSTENVMAQWDLLKALATDRAGLRLPNNLDLLR